MMKLSELMAARCRRPRFFAIAIGPGCGAAGVSLGGAMTGWTGRQFLAWGGTCCQDTRSRRSFQVTGQESLREH